MAQVLARVNRTGKTRWIPEHYLSDPELSKFYQSVEVDGASVELPADQLGSDSTNEIHLASDTDGSTDESEDDILDSTASTESDS